MALRRALVIGVALLMAGTSAPRAQESFRAIWGSGPSDIWAAGSSSTAALHFDGRAWTEVPFGLPMAGGGIAALWGSGPNDVYAAGADGVIVRWDGRAWRSVASGVNRPIVALGGRSARDVFALAQSTDEREAPTVVHFDGRAWTRTPLPLPFRANGMALSGANLLVAGFVANDPTPSERRIVGVLARRVGPRWVMSGWNGRAVTDPVLAGTGWNTVGAAGTVVLLTGENEEGTRVLALARSAAFTVLPPAALAGSGRRVTTAFLASDGVPVAFLNEGGYARFVAGAWVAVGPGSSPTVIVNAQTAQAAGNPTAPVVQMVTWSDLGNTKAAWGTSTDFHVVTDSDRIIRVQGADARIVFDASCANAQMAGMNPICQALRPQGPRPPLPMPSVRVKPRP